jgi:hypothetical protein
VNGSDYSTVTDTAGGSHAARDLKLASNGDSITTTTAADGTGSTEVRPQSGGSVSTNANGTVVTIKETSDPRFPGADACPGIRRVGFPRRFEIVGVPRALGSVARSGRSVVPHGDGFEHECERPSVHQPFNATNRQLTVITPEQRLITQALMLSGV